MGKNMRDWILRLWRGEVSLVKAFWGYLFLGNVVFSIPLLVILIRFEKTGQPAHPLFTGSIFILSVFYFTVACVGVWRSASKYQGRKVWGILAKIMVAGSVARNILEFFK